MVVERAGGVQAGVPRRHPVHKPRRGGRQSWSKGKRLRGGVKNPLVADWPVNGVFFARVSVKILDIFPDLFLNIEIILSYFSFRTKVFFLI